MLEREIQKQLTKSNAKSYEDYLQEFRERIESRSRVLPRYFVWNVSPKGLHLYLGEDREKANLVTNESLASQRRRTRKDWAFKMRLIGKIAGEFFRVVWKTIRSGS